MPIPDFQSLMLPILRVMNDGAEHRSRDVVAELATQFHLTQEELAERIPSGGRSKFSNNAAWAIAHLKMAGVLESAAHGCYTITDRGRQLLREPPERLDLRYLSRFKEYREARGLDKEAVQPTVGPEPAITPEENLAEAYAQIRQRTVEELLERVKSCTPRFFEKLVVELLLAMGYGGSQGAGRAVGRSGDGGIDGTIYEDRLGLDVIYIQAKRWENTVPVEAVRAFAGSLEGHGASKGVLITTSGFPGTAEDYVKRIQKRVILIDGKRLATLMLDHGIGVKDVESYVLKKIDLDYFVEE